LFAQQQKESFKPEGKGIVTIFSNFNSSTSDGTTASEFDLKRVYLGYQIQLSENLLGKVVFDVGDPGVGSLQMTAYVKNASINYSKDQLSASFGMISTTQFKVQEKFWGKRYIEKSVQDFSKMGSSADLGFSAKYEFNNLLSADLIVINGEGYKTMQSDEYLKTGLGISLNPINKLTVRGYYEFMGQDETQTTFSGFIGYTEKNWSLGAEYDVQNNVDYTADKSFTNTSVFTNISLSDPLNIFARYDLISSNTLTDEAAAWNLSNDGAQVIAGIEYSPVKGLKIAPNYRLWSSADDSIDPTHQFYVNLEIKF
jgi:hypothetical protein